MEVVKDTKGMTLKFSTLNDPNFNTTLNKLSKETGFSNFKASYNVAKILRRLTKELKIARDLNLKLVKDYAEVDDKGNPVFDNQTGMPKFLDEEKQKEYQAKHKDFLETEIDLDCSPVTLQDLGTIKLSPHEINALEPILVMENEA